MIEVVWTQTALAGLCHIRAYIAQVNPRAAVRVAQSLHDAGDSLARLPQRGRPVPGTDLRELVADYPYLLRYRVTAEAVVILRIRHAAQQPTTP